MGEPKATYYDELSKMGVNVAQLKKANLSEAELSAIVSGIRKLLEKYYKTSSSGIAGMGFVAMSVLVTTLT